MKKKLTALFLALVMCASLCVPAFAAEQAAVVNRFGVEISTSEYQELIRQGLTDDDIDYLDEPTLEQYLAEAGGELIYTSETHILCKADGTNVELTESEAKAIAAELNQEAEIMPLEDDTGGLSDADTDSVCTLTLVVYKAGNYYRSYATVVWETLPPHNAEDLLMLVHDDVLITDTDDITTTMWYDWSNDGTYHTATTEADSMTLEGYGHGGVAHFDRVVTSSSYNYNCKNFRYKVEMRSVKNNSSTLNALIVAEFYRGIKVIDFDFNIKTDIKISAAKISIAPILTLSARYKETKAPKILSDIVFPVNT